MDSPAILDYVPAGLIVLNKAILSSMESNLILLLLTVQLFITCFIIGGFNSKQLRSTSVQDIKRLSPAAIVYTIMLYFGSKGLCHSSLCIFVLFQAAGEAVLYLSHSFNISSPIKKIISAIVLLPVLRLIVQDNLGRPSSLTLLYLVVFSGARLVYNKMTQHEQMPSIKKDFIVRLIALFILATLSTLSGELFKAAAFDMEKHFFKQAVILSGVLAAACVALKHKFLDNFDRKTVLFFELLYILLLGMGTFDNEIDGTTHLSCFLSIFVLFVVNDEGEKPEGKVGSLLDEELDVI